MHIDLDTIYIPEEKLNAAVNDSLEEIQRLHRKGRIRRLFGVSAAAAASVAFVSAFCISNPVIAEKFTELGEIFGLVQEKQIYSGDYSSRSIPVPGENTCADNGITVTLSEFVCTGESLTVSVLIESEEPFSEEFREDASHAVEGTFPYLRLTTEQGADFAGGALDLGADPYLDVRGEFTDDSTYAGAFRVDFRLMPYMIHEIPDTFRWDLTITEITAPFAQSADQVLSLPGEWHFSTQITRQEELETRTIPVDQYGPDGNGVSAVTLTPYEGYVELGYHEEAAQPGAPSIGYILMLDADGKYIPDKAGRFSPDGLNLSEITVYFTAAPSDKADTSIADKIQEYRVQDENAGTTVLKEYLEEMCVYKIRIPLE